MDRKAIVKRCKDLGCCAACCVRYLGLRNPASYDNPTEFVNKLLECEKVASREIPTTDNVNTEQTDSSELSEKPDISESSEQPDISESSEQPDISESSEQPDSSKLSQQPDSSKLSQQPDSSELSEQPDSSDSTPAKRSKPNDEVCVSCLGLLQQSRWEQMIEMAIKQLRDKGYSSPTFACALSSPLAALVRERAVTLKVKETHPAYNLSVTPLKEAWKWCFCRGLSDRVAMRLDSGSVAPLLVTFNMEYAHDKEEISLLRSLSPNNGNTKASDSNNSRRVVEEMTSRLQLPDSRLLQPPACGANCREVLTEHAPVYLGGRYVKLSRSLPQSPWVLNGVRMMPSSVQEIIFKPIAKLYGIPEADVDRRLKMISAGREDVDVRCLGDGRPFAVEILDPQLTASEQQLRQLCADISGADLRVGRLAHVTKQQLGELKKGEETKFKTYEALCIKLGHTDEDDSGDIYVTAGDVSRVTQLASADGGSIEQRTPLRVLHRRPLHARRRRLLQVEAASVPGHPRLLVVRLQTEAGTYVKEWCHGELGRTTPALRRALPADILALDVTRIHLDWPPPLHTAT